MTGVVSRATYREVFAEPVFRVLFGTRSLAIAADTLRILALSVLVLAITGSPLWTAVAFGIGLAPQAVGGTLLGSVADRAAPRALIVSGYVLECGVATVLGLVRLPVATSLLLVAMVAALTPVFGGASSRLVAEALTGEAYVLGRSMFTVMAAGAQVVGLAVGGLAVAGLGAQRALLVSAGCHLIAAVWVRARLPLLPRPRPAEDWAIGSALGSAVRQSWNVAGALLRDPTVRPLLLVQWMPPAFVTGAQALIVPYVAARGFTPGSAGLMLACMPLGMLVGSVIVGRLVRPHTRERLVAPLLVVLGGPLLGLAAPVPLAAAGALLALVGCGFSYSLGVQRRFLDALPEGHRGQAFALQTTGLMTVQGLGSAAIGAVGQSVSIIAAIVTASVATVLVGVMWLVHSRRTDPVPP